MILKIFLDWETLYNLIYLMVTISSFFMPILYSFLLLDIVKRSEDLKNIFKSITLNLSSLGMTLILGVIILYFFSIYGFLFLSQYYDPTLNYPNYADTLFQAFLSTLNNGLRSGGGIGDTLDQIFITNPDYWSIYYFTLLFFIIINILFINIIFGIIIDTFGDLRDKRQELLDQI